MIPNTHYQSASEATPGKAPGLQHGDARTQVSGQEDQVCALSRIHSSKGNQRVTPVIEGRQPLLEVFAAHSAVLRHALSPPRPDSEVTASRLHRFAINAKGGPSAHGQGNLASSVGPMPFESDSKIFTFHGTQYRSPQVPGKVRSHVPRCTRIHRDGDNGA